MKRSALSRLLLESVTSTAPGERLDEKLAALTFPVDVDERRSFMQGTRSFARSEKALVPPPSSDHEAWWGSPGMAYPIHLTPFLHNEPPVLDNPNGVVPVPDSAVMPSHMPSNPFDSPSESPLSASPSSSDEELFSHALSLPTPMIPVPATRKPPPPPPPPPPPRPKTAGS